VQIGKNRACDLVTRLFSADGVADAARNARLSRLHARLEIGSAEWILADGGVGHPSANGVYLNGTRLGAQERRRLPADVPFRLTLGGPEAADEVMGFTGELVTCARLGWRDCPNPSGCRADRPACLTLQRLDAVAESFLVVGECGAPGLVIPELSPLRLWRRREAFAFAYGTERGWLQPGTRLGAPGAPSVQVVPTQQIGL